MIPSLVRTEVSWASECLRESLTRGVGSSSRLLARNFSTAPVAKRAQLSARTKGAASSLIQHFTPPGASASCAFSTTAAQHQSSGRITVKDPEPQTGLYYHPTQISIQRDRSKPAETIEGWTISFLPHPSSSNNATIAFILPTTSSSSQDSDPADFVRANPDRIRINPAGWKIMHDVLKNDVVPHDDLLKFEASTRESGWAHLTDLRHPLMPGRIATPENIIASVAFTDGELRLESYEENKSYRLVTGYEGPIQMADSWIAKLRKRFELL